LSFYYVKREREKKGHAESVFETSCKQPCIYSASIRDSFLFFSFFSFSFFFLFIIAYDVCILWRCDNWNNLCVYRLKEKKVKKKRNERTQF